MSSQDFTPHHVNAKPQDLEGNNGVGRYLFLPGSDGRARNIAQHFDDVKVRESPRAHHLYLGTLAVGDKKVDVASVCSGMGTPSLDIIVNELFKLGCRRFLRVGTAGSCQPESIRVGNLIVATGAVRDENTSRLYVPPEFPAIASPAFVQGAAWAADKMSIRKKLRYGIIHSKDSLFAREFGEGPMALANKSYMELMEQAGVVASEMESSHLFILASLFDHQMRSQGKGPRFRVLAGTILGIIGDDRPFAPKEEADATVEESIQLSLEVVRQVAKLERVV